MRSLIALPLLLYALFAHAEPAKPGSLQQAFELSGIDLLCAQAAPMIQRGLPAERHPAIATLFAAEPLCAELASQVAAQLDATEVRQVEALLSSPLAQRFTAAERAVGEPGGAQALAEYREQLKNKPPLLARLELVRRVDRAAHTSELATLLRYETGKTQALVAIKARGDNLSEQALGEQTAKQAQALQASSAEAVHSFMLYAYRQMPSDAVQDYATLYVQEPVRRLLAASLAALPKLFAERRAAIK
ncbi:hypothetical protein NVV93_19540 [Pseudomonas sp. LS44]|uniref:hypothetical protein n=1 Tax=Pseudomonas sp. LS44 TaxID=1357074 RepID=UPI00215AEBA1|nr:hypothetical protein [Pseudomonas sp. LS44]UVE17723.1 hypothetical protein NVV93_19540 [Pseudomonas sp. LS44]